MPMPPPQITAVSEAAWLIQWHSQFDLEVNKHIHRLVDWLRLNMGEGVQQLVPAYDSLMIEFSMSHVLKWGFDHLNTKLTNLVSLGWQQLYQLSATQKATSVSIPVCYDPSLGNDREAIMAFSQLQWQEIIALHASCNYQVFFIGFQPGFAYMGSVHASIALPRKADPTNVKAGAVGIAGMQTGIYPFDSPGGWHVIGYTPLKMFDVSRNPPVLLTSGAQVKFEPISIDIFYQLQST